MLLSGAVNTPMSNFEMVKEFQKSFNLACPDVPEVPDQDTLELRMELIAEEFEELILEFAPEDKQVNLKNVAKEMADLLYVVYGMAATLGIPIDKVFREVHRSNMSKLGPDGKPTYRPDGKVLKGILFSPANLDNIVHDK